MVLLPEKSATRLGLRRDGAERRQLTIFFCDLVGSTAMAAALDPEQLREVVDAYHVAAVEAIEAAGGTVAQYLGDGLLVYFGYPVAQEDAAVRSIRCALHVMERMEALGEEWRNKQGIEISARIGIHTGLVVVGEVGRGSKRERLALGGAPNIAARLQSLAEPGQVVISGDTQKLAAAAFDMEFMGEQTLKGIPQPVPVYIVRSAKHGVGSFDPWQQTATRMVGRSGEQRTLRQVWEKVRRGSVECVVIEGEPGIGKSRLISSFREEVELGEGVVLEVFCSPYSEGRPYYLPSSIIRQLAGIRSDDPREERLRKIEALLDLRGVTDPELRHEFFQSMLDEADPAELADPGPPGLIDRLFDAFVRMLPGGPGRPPVVFVIEDAQWLDDSSLGVMQHVMEQASGHRWLWLVTARDARKVKELLGADAARVLSLQGLSTEETASMVRSIPGVESLTASAVQEVIRRTSGVPLFVEELTTLLVEDAKEKRNDGGSAVIPATLQDFLMAKLDRLGEWKELAQLASALGVPFSKVLLQEVSGLELVHVEEGLGELAQHGILMPGLEEGHWRFSQLLMRDATYESMLRSQRQQLHRVVAEVLVTQMREEADSRPDELARHYAKAGMIEPAVESWFKAGRRAAKRFAYAEGLRHLRKGLGILPQIEAEQLRREWEIEYLSALGPVVVALRGYASSETLEVFSRLEELCRGHSQGLEIFQATAGLWAYHNLRADFTVAGDLAERMRTISSQADDNDDIFLVSHASALTSLFYRGNYHRVAEESALVRARHHPEKHRSIGTTFGIDPGGFAWGLGALAEWMLGRPGSAVEMAEKAMEVVRTGGNPVGIAFVLFQKARLHILEGEFEEALRVIQEQQHLTREHGLVFEHLGKVIFGWVLAVARHDRTGLELIDDGIRGWMTTGARLLLSLTRAMQVEALIEFGETAAAERVLEEAKELMKIAEDVHQLSELYRLEGILETVKAQGVLTEAALDAFQQGMETARGQKSPMLELRVALELASWHQRLGRQAAVRSLLEPVLARIEGPWERGPVARARRMLAG
jgi:class 3 adenylate cyclase/tetratricopeptide (TPR) repeat protein